MTTLQITKQLDRIETQLYGIRSELKQRDYTKQQELWKKLGGIWRKRKIINPVAWQRKVRSEWDHRP